MCGAVSIEDNVKKFRDKFMRQRVDRKALIKFNEDVRPRKIYAYGQFDISLLISNFQT
jgi:hypothetical protein